MTETTMTDPTPTSETPPNDVIIGLDLAQTTDYTALSVTEVMARDRAAGNRYAVRALDRFHPHRYQDVVARIERMLPKLRSGVHVLNRDGRSYDYVRPKVTLVLDATGVGAAVADLFAAAGLDVDLQFVTIHGGDTVTRDPARGWRVPKRDLAGVVAVALQNGLVEIAERIPHADLLKGELRNFRAKISASGHETFAAGSDDWREGNHDDLVLAVALSLWWGERGAGPGLDPTFDYAAAFAGIL